MKQVDGLKNRHADMVEAVYQAAKDGIDAMTMPRIPAPVTKSGKGDPEIAIAVLSDWQIGKLTPTYNSEIAKRRIKEYGDKLVKLTNIQRADHPVDEVHVWFIGDQLEGEMIFPGQAHLIDSSLYRQLTIDGPEIMIEFLQKMLANFKKVKVIGVSGNHGCQPVGSARALTEHGLRGPGEISIGDKVWSVDDDGKSILVPVEEVFVYDYDGPMAVIGNSRFNHFATPNHRVVGKGVYSDKWIESRASSFSDTKILMSGHGHDDEYAISDDDIRLAAWCITDSCLSKHGYWSFYQRESKAHRIERLLRNNYSYKRLDRTRDIGEICGKKLKKECEASVEFHVHADDSRKISSIISNKDSLPEWVYKLSRRQVGVFLDEYVYTDGSIPKGKGNVCLYISKANLREDIQRLLTINGYRATATEYRPGHWRLNVCGIG